MKAIYVDGHSSSDEPAVVRRTVATMMSHPVVTVPDAASLDDALRLMVASNVRHLVVLDDDGSYRGIVSDREISAAWAADPDGLTARTVLSIVDGSVPTVGVSTYVVAAARAMRAATTDAVAVVDPAGSIVGIVTGTDLIGLLARYPERS